VTSAAPPAAPRASFAERVRHRAFANGAHVYVLENSMNPTLSISGSLRAGRAYAPADRRLIASVTAGELLKGTEPSPLTFTHLGGQVGDEASAIGGGLQFQPGERVLVFLSRRPDGSLRMVDLTYGRFEIVRDAATGRNLAFPATGATGADRIDLDQLRMLVRRALGGTD